jgi:hypothetical protein
MRSTERTSPPLSRMFSILISATGGSLLSSLLNCNRQAWQRAIICLGLLPLAGCVAPKYGGGSSQQTTVTVSPTSAMVSGAAQQQFTATVTGPQIQAVTWDVNGVQGGDSTHGSIDSTGLYTAPNVVPSPNTVSVTAVAVANGTTSAPATVTVTPSQVAVVVSPTPVNVAIDTTQQFTATVTGTPDTVVGWQVNNILGGNSTYGTISSSGLYAAPTTVPITSMVTVTAISQADSSKQGTATATIAAVAVNVSPTPVSVPVNGTQQFAAAVTGTANTKVTWSVSTSAGCNLGTISASGLYTAPSMTPTSPCPVTVTAVSQQDNTESGSALANLHVTVSIDGPPGANGPPPGAIGIGANWQYTATVNGNSNQNVTWSVTGVAGGTFPDPTSGLYIAPQAVPPSPTVTITATSQLDPTQFGTATTTVQSTDPLGSVSSFTTLTSCAGSLAGGTCYSLDVSCDGVADFETYLKVNTPASGTPLGTVIFGVGTGGSGLYDDSVSSGFKYGSTAVQNVLDAGFTTAQVSFGAPFNDTTPNGWLTGPGGVRRLACRYATVAQWVYDNIHNKNTSAPMCATGNSGGSGAIAYAVSHYGLDSIFAMIEPTSGPPMSRIDEGCEPTASCQTVQTECGTTQDIGLCYGASDAAIIDTAYSQNLCTTAVNGGASNTSLFLSDSVVDGSTVTFNFPKTNVRVLFGGEDNSSAVPQGTVWGGAVTSAKSQACVTDAPHSIPDVQDGATTIATDIIGMCKLQ